MSIQEHLNKIRNAIYGREVRESIAKGIETAYDDASEKDNANMEVKIARGTHPNLRSRLEEVDDKQQQTTAQLAQTATNVVNILEFEHLKTLNGEGYDWTVPIQRAVEKAESLTTYPDYNDSVSQMPSVSIPAGMYKTTSEIVVESPINIIGEGSNASVIENIGTQSTFKVLGELRESMNQSVYLDNPKTTFLNLGLYGSHNTNQQHGIKVVQESGRYASRVFIDHLKIYNFGGHGVYSIATNGALVSNRVLNSEIVNNNGAGIHAEEYHTDFFIFNNTIRLNRVGIHFKNSGSTTQAGRIMNNLIESNHKGSGTLADLSGRPAMGIVLEHCHAFYVNENYFEGHWIDVYMTGSLLENSFENNRHDQSGAQSSFPNRYGKPSKKFAPYYTLDASAVQFNSLVNNRFKQPKRPTNVTPELWNTSEWGDTYEHAQLSGTTWLIKDNKLSGQEIDLEIMKENNYHTTYLQIEKDGGATTSYKMSTPSFDIEAHAGFRVDNLITDNGKIMSLDETNSRVSREYGVGKPTTGNYRLGSIVWNIKPEKGSPIGWVCVESGEPGTWESFSNLDDTKTFEKTLSHNEISEEGISLTTILGGFVVESIVFFSATGWGVNTPLTVYTSSENEKVEATINSQGLTSKVTSGYELGYANGNRTLRIRKGNATTQGEVTVKIKFSRA